MNPSLIIVSILVSILCGGCQSNSSKTLEDECTSDEFRADQAIKNGDYAAAERFYQDALLKAKSSDNALRLPLVYQEEADLFDLENKLDKTQSCLRESLALYAVLDKAHEPGVKTVLSAKQVHEGMTKSLVKLAHVLERQGKLDEAEERFKEALNMNKSSGGQVDESLRITKSYAQLLRKDHKEKEAEDLETEADSANLVSVELDPRLWKQVRIYDAGEQFADSLHWFKTIALAAKRFNKTGLFCTATRYRGLAEYSLNQMSQAEQSLREAVKAARTLPRDEHYSEGLSVELGTLGCFLLIEGKDAEGNQLLKQAETIDSNTMAGAIFHVVNTSLHKGSIPDAVKLSESFQKLADQSPKKSKKLYHILADCWVACADWSHVKKDPEKEKESAGRYRYMVEKALANYNLSDKADPATYGDLLARSAEVEITSGNLAVGCERLDKACAIAQQKSSDLPRLACELAAAKFVALNNLDKAIEYYTKALSLYDKSHTRPDLYIDDVDALVRILQTHGQVPLAVTFCQRGLAVAEAKIPSAVPGRLNQLAGTLRMQNKLAEAEKLYRRSLILVEKHFGARSNPTASTFQQFADCLFQEEKYDEAKLYYERTLSIYQNELAGKATARADVVKRQLGLIARAQAQSPQK